MKENTAHAGLAKRSWCWWKDKHLNCFCHHYSYHATEILVTCCSLFKQTPKKEHPSICFGSAPIENFIPEHRSALVSDFECHSPFALLHKKLNCKNNRRVSPKKQKRIAITIIIIIIIITIMIIIMIVIIIIYTFID